jgi:SSS family solute:Na+ symporter
MFVSRLVVVLLFGFGLLIALRPISTLVAITTLAFTGIGILYPATIAGLYWKRANSWAVLASILSGESVALLASGGFLPAAMLLGSLPIIPGLLVATGVLIGGSFLCPASNGKQPKGFFEFA